MGLQWQPGSPSPTLGNHIGGQPGALGVWQEAAGGPSYHSNGQRVSSGLSSMKEGEERRENQLSGEGPCWGHHCLPLAV